MMHYPRAGERLAEARRLLSRQERDEVRIAAARDADSRYALEQRVTGMMFLPPHVFNGIPPQWPSAKPAPESLATQIQKHLGNKGYTISEKDGVVRIGFHKPLDDREREDFDRWLFRRDDVGSRDIDATDERIWEIGPKGE